MLAPQPRVSAPIYAPGVPGETLFREMVATRRPKRQPHKLGEDSELWGGLSNWLDSAAKVIRGQGFGAWVEQCPGGWVLRVDTCDHRKAPIGCEFVEHGAGWTARLMGVALPTTITLSHVQSAANPVFDRLTYWLERVLPPYDPMA